MTPKILFGLQDSPWPKVIEDLSKLKISAVVRAMDTVTAFISQEFPYFPKVEKFIVAGASKVSTILAFKKS